MGTVTGTEGGEKVILATLVRGKNYTYHEREGIETGDTIAYHQFERAIPKPVTEKLAGELELLSEEVEDGDGDMITKDVFLIDRDAPARGVIGAAPKKKRFRIVEEEVEERPVLRMPVKKPLPAPAVKKPGFGNRG